MSRAGAGRNEDDDGVFMGPLRSLHMALGDRSLETGWLGGSSPGRPEAEPTFSHTSDLRSPWPSGETHKPEHCWLEGVSV